MVQGGPGVQIGIVVATVAGLWIGARLLVDSVVRLARRVGLSELTIGLTIVAAGTSTPELVVTTDAALGGFGDIAVGNIVGSNVYNLAFILGVVSLIRIIPIERSLVHRDGIALIASTLLGGMVLLDGTVTRLEGGAFVGLFVLYTAYLLRNGGQPPEADPPQGGTGETEGERGDGAESTSAAGRTGVDEDPPAGVSTSLTERVDAPGRDVVLVVVGLAVVLVSGDFLVGAATNLARGAGISEWVIGGTIVAAGTSTPEFAVSLVAMRSGRIGVSVGNVVGSNVFNMLGIMGLAAVLQPIAVGGAALETIAWLAVLSVVMVAALWTGRQLSRIEGGLFALSEAGRWILGLLGLVG
jgi:cation:H+ antiporter